MRRVWVVAIVAYLAILAACVYWVTFLPTDPARYVAVLDELSLPASWQVDNTATQRDAIMGSRATRWFLVDAEPEDSNDVLEEALHAVGFALARERVSRDWCDPPPLDSVHVSCAPSEIQGCKAPPGGAITCLLRATRGPDLLYATMAARGEISVYTRGSEQRRIDPTLSLVVITVEPAT